ncbi:MAG: formimidoylglutamase [Thermaurantimonas sp.]
MDLSELLYPVPETCVEDVRDQIPARLGSLIRIHSEFDGLPDLENIRIAIIGAPEDRASKFNKGSAAGVDKIRYQLYRLFPGNWNPEVIADLGNLHRGQTIADTHAALKIVCEELIIRQIIPVVIGGSNDLLFPIYKSFEKAEQFVNICSVDPQFDLGNQTDEITDLNYLSRIVLHQPYLLNNFTNIGYQTYMVSPDEIQLMEKMYFDYYRLGDLRPVKRVEPLVRNADIVSFDMMSIKAADNPGHAQVQPNGFTGDEACSVMRYVGLSDKLSAIGIFGYNPAFDHHSISAALASQMLWYFIEGFFLRKGDYPLISKKDFLKFTVIIEDGDYHIIFYKNPKTGRWWMEVPATAANDQTRERHLLIPCDEEDYNNAINQEIPLRWWKVYQKSMLLS